MDEHKIDDSNADLPAALRDAESAAVREKMVQRRRPLSDEDRKVDLEPATMIDDLEDENEQLRRTNRRLRLSNKQLLLARRNWADDRKDLVAEIAELRGEAPAIAAEDDDSGDALIAVTTP